MKLLNRYNIYRKYNCCLIGIAIIIHVLYKKIIRLSFSFFTDLWSINVVFMQHFNCNFLPTSLHFVFQQYRYERENSKNLLNVFFTIIPSFTYILNVNVKCSTLWWTSFFTLLKSFFSVSDLLLHLISSDKL